MRFFFFFQAEDGIRDADVTGVQTCALPISRLAHDPERLAGVEPERDVVHGGDDPRAARGDVVRGEVPELEQRGVAHSWRSCGSSFTRSQSPRRLAARTMSMMQTPGSTVSHQYPAIMPFLPSASMRPQAGLGGGTPTPRNDSAASVTMTTPSISVPSTMAEFSTLGRMWRRMIVRLVQLATMARRTKSRSLSERTSPRMTRA